MKSSYWNNSGKYQKLAGELVDGSSGLSQVRTSGRLLTKEELAAMCGEKINVRYIGPCEGFYQDGPVSFFGALEQGVSVLDGKLQATSFRLDRYGTSWIATSETAAHPTAGKLVRDKIPDIIRENGEVPITRKLDNEEFQHALCRKLQEEVDEFLTSGHLAELADILEVVYTIGASNGYPESSLNYLRESKAKTKGRFIEKTFLGKVKAVEAESQKKVICYQTGIEIPEILGSGSALENVFTTTDETMAFMMFNKDGRNYLSRTVKRDGHLHTEYYDTTTHTWKN